MADVGSMNIEEGQTLQRPPSLSLDPNNTSSMDANPYDDASSGGFYTLDDIDIGETSTDDINVGETSLDDVYSDCVTTLLEAVPDADLDRSIESSVNTIVDVTEVSNTPLNNNTKVEGKSPDRQAPPPVYFELETVSDRQDSVITPDMQPSVQEITQAFEALSGDHPVQGLKKQTLDDDFTPVLHDIPPSENPFEGFEVVDDTPPVYEHGKPKSGETTDTVGDQTMGISHSGTGEANGEISERILSEPIYDVVPSRDSSERGSGHSYMSLLPEEPIYEVVCHDTTANGQTGSKVKGQCKGGSHGDIPAPPPGLGSVYSVAKGAVDKSQNQTNLPSNLAKGAATSSMYDMAKPIPAGFAAESVLTRDDFMVRSHPPGFVACKQGSGRPYSVHFLENAGAARKGLKTPPKALEDGDYDRLKFRRFNSKKLKSRSQFYIGYNGEDDTVLEDFPPQDVSPEPEPEPVVSQDKLYESISSSRLSDDGWGSSEFEESGEDEVLEQAPAKPLPPEPKQGAKIINRIRSLARKNNVNMYEETRCFPVDLNPSKHPPPELPPPPDDLSESQKKRRCVVDLTISSEKSYINALERITEDYMKVVMENIASPRSQVKTVFAEAEQILSHHKMFQIELADRVRKWDQEGKIGDIFTASFSKTMLLNSYSVYVNSFAAAMEEIKTVQRTKQTFSDFLKAKESSSSDRLSIFGLMVKPVQRFPQFIMLLQDLLKYTPQTHHDRGALQLALTELENVTHKLNERKRHSEQQFAARQITSQLSRQLVMKVTESPRRLLRQDDMEQVVGETASMKSKKVRVFLMNDTVLFVKVGFKDQGGYPTERYRLKWMANIRDVEVKDSAITPDMESVVKGGPGKISIYSTQIDKPEEDPFHLFADLNEMLHDFPVLAQISALVSTLKRSYMGLTEELTQELRRDLQRLIHIKDEQLRLVNSCSIILSDYTKNEKIRYVLQTPTASIKHEWCMDFLIAKLATDKQNNPGWGDMGNEEDEDLPPAFFMRCLPVDVPRNYTKMMCAIPVFMTSSSGTRLGIQHLWVVTTTPTRGQVSIISIHNSKPSLTESFKAADVEVTCTEHVPGYAKDVKEYAYEEDCVWLGTIDNEILIFPLTSSDGMRREAVAKFTLPAAPVSMKYVDERIFCGLVNGSVAVFSRDKDGAWNVNSPLSLNLSNTIISCMKVIDDDLWVALTTKILVLEIDSLKERTTHDLSNESEDLIIHEFTTSGVGIWVSFKDSAKLRLYHTETLENLQEINIASAVNRLLEERKSKDINGDQLDGYSSCVITSLSASKGLLWIGTNHGFVLTLPLPRLKDGVPLASGRPKISLHSHRGPVKFLIPIYYSSSVAELNRNSSLWSSLRPKRPSLNDRATVVNQNKTEGITSPVSDSGTDGVISPDGKSHSETWQAEIDKLSAIGENTGESPVIGQTETASESNSVLQPIAEVDTSNSNDKSNSAKTPQSARRRKSVKDSESLKRDKPKRLKSKTLSFRSELANKIAKRNFESSDSELAEEEEDEVRLLYENLMETDDDMEQENEDDSFQDAISSFEELPSDLGSPENALSARKDSQTVKWGSEVRLRATSASTRSRHGTLHRGGSPQAHKTATMRKNPCNAVIVVGGGDGYVDWNKTTKQRTSEDASLLLWIYKL
ncbi:rho guanine nucleotide exchange factor 10-like protein [Haliotis cracherodii]|uniref:rho guanine nucleotide exchange factor 10-like protein n=1 Tax=Haliotis cracherodii TaxID=6455 RepID=UPI0039ED4D5A